MQEFISWWQHMPERIDPVFFHYGVLQIRYYGLMYLTSFLVTYGLARHRAGAPNSAISRQTVEDYLTWIILGILIGARLGYVFFYNFSFYVSHPLEIFLPIQVVNDQVYFGISGLSYHGGLVGGIAATILFCRKRRINVLSFGDLIIPAVPLGYMFGRLGNFFNGELYGRTTEQWWGMYFPNAPTVALRHPSQLYEAFFEGLFLFALLWACRDYKPLKGKLFFLYMFGYGVVRFFIEFFREPDAHLGLLGGALSMGQFLCLIMIIAGLAGLIKTSTKKLHDA